MPQKGPQEQTVIVGQPIGGVIRAVAREEQPPNTVIDANNVVPYSSDGRRRICQRWGTSIFTGSSTGMPIQGMLPVGYILPAGALIGPINDIQWSTLYPPQDISTNGDLLVPPATQVVVIPPTTTAWSFATEFTYTIGTPGQGSIADTSGAGLTVVVALEQGVTSTYISTTIQAVADMVPTDQTASYARIQVGNSGPLHIYMDGSDITGIPFGTTNSHLVTLKLWTDGFSTYMSIAADGQSVTSTIEASPFSSTATSVVPSAGAWTHGGQNTSTEWT